MLEDAKANVCGKLTEASTAVASAQANHNGEVASTASWLATHLATAASLLNTVGLTDVPNDVSSVSSDLRKLATAAPSDVEQLASDIQTTITSADSTLACPSASASVSTAASPSASM
jgi:hypothetical protein